MTGDYREIDVKEYQSIIIESFTENYTPKSFNETTTKLSAMTKNWLTQTSVNRSVVFLLGFGLNMSVSDVSEFLKKVIREHDFNFKDPQEVVCKYRIPVYEYLKKYCKHHTCSKNPKTVL